MAPFARGNRKEGSTTSNGQGAPAPSGGYKRLRETIEMVDTLLQMGASVFHVFVRIIGPVFICIALGLISFCTYTYFGYVLPNMAETIGLSGQILITAVGVFLLFNILVNYACAVCKNAGTPPEHEQAATIAAEKGERTPRKCEKCSPARMKPVRAHHCSVCRRCVLKMDHHCPWINNCVGWANYRNFCLFMLYLAMGCCYVMLVYGPFMFDIPEAAHGVEYHLGLLQEDDYRQWLRQNKVNSRRRSIGNDAQYFIVFSVMIAMSIFIALSILGGFHAYLVLTNQTTIEFQLNMLRRRDARKREDGIAFRNVYDMGRTRNFQQVFGPHRFCGFSWMFPLCSKGPDGDGMEFPSSSRS